MNKYESLIVIDQNVSKKEIGNIIENITNLINRNGKLLSVQSLGVLMPKDNVKGNCFVFKFEANLEIVEELEKYYGKNGKIVYDLTVARKE